ncbi:putative acetyltransferase [Cohnella sp. SGD-V74]|uniref:GNAT family N-acetyltransferase n=1 Tax=unclassified Cohnella TaxID=2636738 RepID=UPI000D3FEFD2|nr:MULTISPECIES: GNAT family N-acetyltransferase [unclassified Cohnella]PRX72979.1 putative acetyltransferase [Cohnella sp. SGD-V74]
MELEIRQLTEQDYYERMALSQFAFQMRWTEDQLEQRKRTYLPEQDWGVFDGANKLLSALTLLPLEVWVQGKKMAMGGVAGVATWPEARRQGCVGRLLSHALETMRNEGQSLSMLHPFSFPFYRRYGYELTIERKKYAIPTRLLPSRKETPGEVRRMAEPDVAVLDAIYSAYASRYNGTLARSAEWWTERALRKEGTAVVYFNEAGSPEGYVFYDCLDSKMTVHEIVALSETARTALWTFIANHDSMIGETTLFAPIDDGFPYLLDDPRIGQELLPYFMSRIVDAEAFAKQYAWEQGTGEESVLLRLEDRHAPWNDGTFRLSWSKEGEGTLERIDGAEDSEADVIACDIQALTAMLLGERKPTWLASVGRVSGAAESLKRLERRIPERTAYLMDFF